MNEEQFDNYVKAGKIAQEVVSYAKEFIKSKMLLIDIAEKIDSKISELGAKPAFPVNLSINEIAAHYTPAKNDEKKAEGLLKVDIGVEVNGMIADTAFSLDLTEDKEFQTMIDKNEEILSDVLEKLNEGSEVSFIGNRITKLLEGSEFNIIRNLSGHSLGENEIHAGLTISNCENNNETILEDIGIAIEPFLTTGNGEVYEGPAGEIFTLQNPKKQVRDSSARKILKFIKEEYKTKPFCSRWLEDKFEKVSYCLRLLTKEGIVYNYPVLIEKSKKPVSQREHTIVFFEGKKVVTSRD